MQKIKEYWLSLDDETIVNRKLMFFEIATAFLAGFLVATIFLPFRSITIASNNEGCCANASCGSDEDEDD